MHGGLARSASLHPCVPSSLQTSKSHVQDPTISIFILPLSFFLSFFSRCSVISGCVFSVISIILLVVGLIIDGIVFGATNGLDTCVDQDTNKYYGDSKYNIYAEACRIDHSQTCVCVNSDNTDNCYLFNLQAADNCGQILTKLPSLLLASVLFMLVLIVVVFVYSIFTCKTVCCASPEDAARMNGTAQAGAGSVPTVPVTAVAQPVSNKV